MRFYKEVALSTMYHNGKQYDKGTVLRERVPLTESQAKVLNDTPTLTNCEYILIEEEPVIKVDRAELFKKANEAVEAGLLEKAPAKNIKTEDLIKLLEGINEKN